MMVIIVVKVVVVMVVVIMVMLVVEVRMELTEGKWEVKKGRQQVWSTPETLGGKCVRKEQEQTDFLGGWGMVELAGSWGCQDHKSCVISLLGSQHPPSPAAQQPCSGASGSFSLVVVWECGDSWRQEWIKKDRWCHLTARPLLLQSVGSRARPPPGSNLSSAT